MSDYTIKRKVNTIKDLKELLSHLNDSDEIFFDLGTKASGVQSLSLDIENIESHELQGNPNYCVVTFKTDHGDIIQMHHDKQQTIHQIKSIIKNE